MQLVKKKVESTMIKANHQLHEFAGRELLADALAEQIEAQIDQAIAQRGQAIIALSGGSTPKPLFERLSRSDIDWANVVVTLVDERWVPIGHDLSNGGFLLDNLLNKLPIFPKFVPLFAINAAALNVQQSLIPVLSDYCQQTGSTHANPAAFDVVILGMGTDGHTASFFPDAENIQQLIDGDGSESLVTCHSPSTQVDRVTWSLPALLNTQFLALHFTGIEKKQVFKQALLGDDVCELPIRSAIFQNRRELQVYYAD